jgi:hypothetical protein
MESNRGAIAGQRPRDFKAHAAGRSSDKRDFAIQGNRNVNSHSDVPSIWTFDRPHGKRKNS